MKIKKTWLPVLMMVLVGVSATKVLAAGEQINIVARAVLASNEGEYQDPGLGPLIGELQSVFRYSSYRLLSQDRLALSLNQTGTVSLPGKRALQITPTGITGNRAEMQLSILKNGRRIFDTMVQLRNGASVTVGGPKHKGGYLLFNIFASF